MNASTKVLAILSISAAIGNLIAASKTTDRTPLENETLNWRGKKLAEAGASAVVAYPFPSLTKSKIKQVNNKVAEICESDDKFDIVEKLSFLVTALVDIRAYIKPKRWELIDPVLTRAKWCLQFFDSKYEAEELYIKVLADYEKWDI